MNLRGVQSTSILIFKTVSHSKAKYVLAHTNAIFYFIWNLKYAVGKYKFHFIYEFDAVSNVFFWIPLTILIFSEWSGNFQKQKRATTTIARF